MTTATKGLRYELKKVTTSGAGNQQDLLSVPANSNYFIFINYMNSANKSNGVANIYFDGNVSEGPTGIQDVNSNAGPMDFAVNAPSVGIQYHERLVYPGGFVRTNFGQPVEITYTEVYFGGQSSNF